MAEIIEKLAEGIHEQWRQGDWPNQPHLDVPYVELAPSDKEENRAAARRIPDVLGRVRLGIVSLEQAKLMQKPTKDDVELAIEAQIEHLAQVEHDGWMAHRSKNGWSYGPVRDNAKKLHPLMVPYSQLPELEKEKDRSAVRNYPNQVESAGLAIVWL
jgi:RyR domain